MNLISRRRDMILIYESREEKMIQDNHIATGSGEKTVAILFPQEVSTFSFTAREMKKKLERANFRVTLMDVSHLSSVSAAYKIVLTTRADLAAGDYPGSQGFTLPVSKPEGYSIRKNPEKDDGSWYVIGSDKSGAMYGGLDFADEIQASGLSALCEVDDEPYLASRGIKLNIPLDARTPSYSDSGDSAQANIGNMWDMGFWHEFLNEMAKCKLNTLSLWNLHPFPSMVKVPSYPNAALNDVMKTTAILNPDLMARGMSTPESLADLQLVKKMTIEEKIDFWRAVMLYAQDRGIDTYLFTWNIFIYGTEHSGYDFTTSVTDTHTQDYFRKSVEALISTYPLLKGIGITAGENMSRDSVPDETWLYNAYGKGIQDALSQDENRKFRLIHRIQFANISLALKTFSNLHDRCILETSFKYAQAHVYSSVRPGYVHEHDDAYLRDIGGHKTWLTLRDDDYYMFRGGSDPDFIREFVLQMPHAQMQGFYLGADGYTWGREYISMNPDSPQALVLKKRWYSLMLWGNLTYNPHVKDDKFIHALQRKFPTIQAGDLFTAWAKASQIIPLVNRFHNEKCQMDFEWYPEGCTSLFGFHDIDRFIRSAPQPGEGIIGIPAYVENLKNGVETTDDTPVSVAERLWEITGQCIHLLQGLKAADDKELDETIGDIRAMASLGQYYSRKILGALHTCMTEKENDTNRKNSHKTQAIQYLEEASAHWMRYAASVSGMYQPQALTRMVAMEKGLIPPFRQTDISALQKEVDLDIEIARKLC